MTGGTGAFSPGAFGPGAFRPGVRLGVDVGEVRVGVARCDDAGVIATPLETVRRGRGDIARLVDLIEEHAAIEVIVGLPLSLTGVSGLAAAKATAFAERIADEIRSRDLTVSVRLSDERLTTVSAERVLRERGRTGAKRRAVVDQAAAVVILQHALDSERTTGVPPGAVVRRDS
jgi:putative Holliday junction resolvase